MTNLDLITNRISSKVLLEMQEEAINEGILSSLGSAAGKVGKYIKDAGSDFSAGFKSGYYGQPIEKYKNPQQIQQEPEDLGSDGLVEPQQVAITQNSGFYNKHKNLILNLIG